MEYLEHYTIYVFYELHMFVQMYATIAPVPTMNNRIFVAQKFLLLILSALFVSVNRDKGWANNINKTPCNMIKIKFNVPFFLAI